MKSFINTFVILLFICSCTKKEPPSGGTPSNNPTTPTSPTYSVSMEAHRTDPGNAEVKDITIKAYVLRDGSPYTGCPVTWAKTSGTLSSQTEIGSGYYSARVTLPANGGESEISATCEGITGAITVIGADYLDSEWDVPIKLTINTSGWEDTPFIAPDGQKLYFCYAGFDIVRLLTDIGNSTCNGTTVKCHFYQTGEARTGSHGWYNFDIFEATRTGENTWSVADSSVNINDYTTAPGELIPVFYSSMMDNSYPSGAQLYHHECSPFFYHNNSTGAENMLWMAMTTSGALIYYAERANSSSTWGNYMVLPTEVNSGGDSDNPRIVFNGDASHNDYLYFDSGAIAGEGGKDIFVRKLSDFSSLSILDTVNTSSDEQQAFITSDNKTIYFASNRNDGVGDGHLNIWKASRANTLTTTNFDSITKILSMWKFAGVASASLPSDGSEMFFAYVKLSPTYTSPQLLDGEIGYIKKR